MVHTWYARNLASLVRHAGVIPATGTPTGPPSMTTSTANGVTTRAHPSCTYPTLSVHAVVVAPAAPEVSNY